MSNGLFFNWMSLKEPTELNQDVQVCCIKAIATCGTTDSYYDPWSTVVKFYNTGLKHTCS